NGGLLRWRGGLRRCLLLGGALPRGTIRGRALTAAARRAIPLRRPLAIRRLLSLGRLAAGELLDQLLAPQHSIARHVRLGGKLVQVCEVLGLQLSLGHDAAGYCSD